MASHPPEKNPFLAPRGTHDIMPSDWIWWDRLSVSARKLAEFYHFSHIETPVLEEAGLVSSALGEETDAVEKELYTVRGKTGETLVLRPDGAPGVARAYMEHRLSRSNPFQKLWYLGPMFRAG
jgi:histidyl-tRNA synthetase